MPKTRAEFTFGSAFQENVLALMLSDLNFTHRAIQHVPEERLYSEAHKFLFNAIKEKFEKDGTSPSFVQIEDMIKYAERHKRRMLKAFASKIYDLKVSDAGFIKDSLTDYARKTSFIQIFQDGQAFWNAREHDKVFKVVEE